MRDRLSAVWDLLCIIGLLLFALRVLTNTAPGTDPFSSDSRTLGNWFRGEQEKVAVEEDIQKGAGQK